MNDDALKRPRARDVEETWRETRQYHPPERGYVAPDTLDWWSTVTEIPRGDAETVRAVSWSRNGETVITLQWLLNGADGTLYPVNIPPTPADFA